MFVTSHALAGLLLGQRLAGRRPVGLPAGLAPGVASHLMMDTLPHVGDWRDDADFLRAARTDGLLCLGVVAWAVAVLRGREGGPLILTVAAGAVLPDLAHPVRRATGRSPYPGWFDRFHQRIQNEERSRMPRELLAGVALAVGAGLRLPAVR